MNSVYLMLVTFLVHGFSSLTPAMVSEFQKSPYRGIAVPIHDHMNPGPVPSLASFDSDVARLKSVTSKDLWPWVFTNMLIGVVRRDTRAYAQDETTLRIQGWDLDNQAGARERFLQWWRLSFQLAKQLGAPGAVADLEPYNNYASGTLPELAREIGRSPDETVRLLEALGGRMADIAATELPGAKIFYLTTNLQNPRVAAVGGKWYYGSETYIVIGTLERIRQARLDLTVISGNESGLGYCSDSLDDLRGRIQSVRSNMSHFLSSNAGHLVEAGTMTLWADASLKGDWLASGPCAANPAGNVEELEPYIQELLRSYQYVWIYAASPKYTGYQPFDPDIAPRFNVVLRHALSATGNKSD